MAASSTATSLAPASDSLVRLLGDSRARIVTWLREEPRTVAQLAGLLGVSEVATRRHLAVLEEEGFVTSTSPAPPSNAPGRGRPAAWYQLTADAEALFPHRYDRLASEVLDFLTEQHGRAGLRAFLRWRLERETAELREAVTAEDLHERLGQLAHKLSDAGFAAEVQPTDDGFRLVQNHCTIAEVAKEHPEVCAYEAAAFSQVLGRDVSLSRRDTLATGAAACVCSVSTADRAEHPAAPSSDDRPTTAARTSPSPQDRPSSQRAGDHQ